MERVLVYLSIVYKGNWDKIYKAVLNKEYIDKNIMEETLNNTHDKYVTLLSPNYPEILKYIFKPPFVLYYRGNIDLLKEKIKIAVVGNRKNTEYGKETTEKICSQLVTRGNVVIVSGLAKGIDSIAHKTCLKENGKTIAVLGNGLDIIYPKENAELYKEISDKGLIISEYPFGTNPEKKNFLERNRIIAGLSDGVVVTEAKEVSGTMNTICHALESGKQIFCVPDKLFNNSGCNKLIKEGAKLIENGNDVLEEFENI